MRIRGRVGHVEPTLSLLVPLGKVVCARLRSATEKKIWHAKLKTLYLPEHLLRQLQSQVSHTIHIVAESAPQFDSSSGCHPILCSPFGVVKRLAPKERPLW